MRRYVKLANDPTFYLVDGDGAAQAIHSPAEVHRIGLLPVEVVSEAELARLREAAPQPAGTEAPAVVIDPSDGIDDAEASAASRALNRRKAQRKAAAAEESDE